MSHKRTISHVGLIIVMALFLGFFNLPFTKQEAFLPITPDRFENQKIHLGLDLQGGTQLDYKLDLRKVNEEDKDQIIDGVFEVITRRVNGLGVSEPNIYRSQIADEEHIVVELAGVTDLEEAKNTVGKTIQLEFKEENNEPVKDSDIENVRTMATQAMTRIQNGEAFEIVAEEEELANPGKAVYFQDETEEGTYEFESVLHDDFVAFLKNAQPGDVSELLQASDGYTFDTEGNLRPLEGFFILKLHDKRMGQKNIETPKEVDARHVLIAYAGAERAEEGITRTKEEAQKLAEEIYQRALNGESVADLAVQYSDEPGAENTKGHLGNVNADSNFVKPFKDAALALSEGAISEPVETQFGFHVIEVSNVVEAVHESVDEMEYRVERLFYTTEPNPWKETTLTGEHFVRADVEFTQTYAPYVAIQFNEEGGKLFEALTEQNLNKRIAIFVGGDLISAPNVNEKISGGRAQISGDFTIEEASALARDLNTGAIPAPIILVGQYTIGASLGQDALHSSVRAGIIGLIVLALYMLLYYRLPGLLANAALLIYAAILIFFLKVAMPMGLALAISFVVFLWLVSATLKSRDSGGEKLLSFGLACFVLFFLSFLLSTPVVLTLAGVAGVVLSIGMAVDANILIFERMREELRNKRPYLNAVEVGFERAWSSIRDSNFSSLITCAILIYFGSSIIKGFAVNLALGILISMFTAITITRTFLISIANTKWATSDFFLGTPKKAHPRFPIVQSRKVWFAISGALIIASLIVIPINGLKLGLDFTGGTLLELQFDHPITSEEITNSVQRIEDDLVAAQSNEIMAEPAISDSTDSPSNPSLTAFEEDRPEEINFGEPLIVSSGENRFIVRMKHISNESHDALLAGISQDLGTMEETRFTTIGPTIGATMKQKAIVALGMAILAIVLYIAFAFRRIPKEVSAWRFGVTAIAALIHDVLITVGIFVVLGSLLGVEIDALFITALLTIMGFSVHDTIVTFDRIRENLYTQASGETFENVANRAVNETLARSINTSLSTLITVVMLFWFGAESIHYFLLALIIGLIAGTYSSVFVATPLLVVWHKRKNSNS